MDIKSSEDRSLNMAQIKNKNTKPELYIRSLLYSKGYRYRVNSAKIFGKPDLYFSKSKTAVFVNGCYWHRHSNCQYSYTPKTNTEFWNQKFKANIKRDAKVQSELLKQNIHILVIWECSIKSMKKDQNTEAELLDKIEGFINNPDTDLLEI